MIFSFGAISILHFFFFFFVFSFTYLTIILIKISVAVCCCRCCCCCNISCCTILNVQHLANFTNAASMPFNSWHLLLHASVPACLPACLSYTPHSSYKEHQIQPPPQHNAISAIKQKILFLLTTLLPLLLPLPATVFTSAHSLYFFLYAFHWREG